MFCPGPHVDGNGPSTGRPDGVTGRDDVTGGGDGGVFSSDRRYLAYNALVMVLFYWTMRRCVSLAGAWPCGDAVSCSSAIEWIVTAAGAVQAMVSVAVATVHRRTSTADLLNRVYDVLRARGPRSRHVRVAGGYAATVAAFALVRAAAVAAARPDRFPVADVLLLWLPVAAAPIAVESAIVCVCAAAEGACRDVADRLRRLAADVPCCRTLPTHWRLEMAWRDHWRVCLLVDRLSRCFGVDLAVHLTANMLLFIGYAYVTLVSVHNTTWSAGPRAAVYWNAALVCQLAGVSFRIVFVSYRAEKIRQAVSGPLGRRP